MSPSFLWLFLFSSWVISKEELLPEVDAGTPAAVANHVDGLDGGAGDFALLTDIVHSNLVGIDTVGKACHATFLAKGQEVELDFKVTRCAVGDATDEPLVALTLCYHAILAGLSCKNTCLVPVDGNAGEEVAAIRPLVVAAGIVHQHLQVALSKHKDSQVECLSAHTGTDGTVAVMTFGLLVQHRAGRVVHWSDGIADEGQPNGVVGLARAVVLHAAHSFVGQYVGILVVQSAGMEGSVEIDEDVMRGGSWFNTDRGCRVSFRSYSMQDSRYHYLGLRLAL